VGPFGFGDGTFDNHMIDLSVVISQLPLIVEVSVRASGDGENCFIGGKVVILLWRLTNLKQRWGMCVGFWLDLLICAIWHWIGNL
jgi:hypothetical protein